MEDNMEGTPVICFNDHQGKVLYSACVHLFSFARFFDQLDMEVDPNLDHRINGDGVGYKRGFQKFSEN